MITRATRHRYHTRLKNLLMRMDRGWRHLGAEALQSAGVDAGGSLANVLDSEDMVNHRAEQEVSLQLMGSEELLIKEIQDALDRIDGGTFGRCEACFGPVGRSRLQALPYTRYCIDCAREMELGAAPE